MKFKPWRCPLCGLLVVLNEPHDCVGDLAEAHAAQENARICELIDKNKYVLAARDAALRRVLFKL